MTNFEKYKEQILEIIDTTDMRIAVCNGVLYPCEDVPCDDCYLHHGGGSCDKKFIKWLCQEYQEKPKLSERAYHFLKSLPKFAWIKYADGVLFIQVGGDIASICCDINVVIPKLLLPVEDVWYEVSEILKWEVEG